MGWDPVMGSSGDRWPGAHGIVGFHGFNVAVLF